MQPSSTDGELRQRVNNAAGDSSSKKPQQPQRQRPETAAEKFLAARARHSPVRRFLLDDNFPMTLFFVAIIPCLYVFNIAYQNISIPSGNLRPWPEPFVANFEHKQNYSIGAIAMGGRAFALPYIAIGRYMQLNGHTLHVLGDASARDEFVAHNIAFSALDDPFLKDVLHEHQAADSLWKQGHVGHQYFEGDNGIKMMDQMRAAMEKHDVIVATMFPWSVNMILNVAESLGKPVFFLMPYPGEYTAYEFALDMDGSGQLKDYGHWFYNSAVSRVRSLISGFMQRSTINRWRVQQHLEPHYLIEAYDYYNVLRYFYTFPSWSPMLLNKPEQGMYRFVTLMTDFAIYDHQVFGEHERQFHNMTLFEGNSTTREDIEAFCDTHVSQGHRVAYVDLQDATPAQITALAKTLAEQHIAAIVHPKTPASAAWDPKSTLHIKSFDSFDYEGTLLRSDYAFHHGDTYLLSQSIRQNTSSVVFPSWLRVWHSYIRSKHLGAVVQTPDSPQSIAAAIAEASTPQVAAALDKLFNDMYKDWGIILFARMFVDAFMHVATVEERKELHDYKLSEYGHTEMNIFEP